VTELTDKQKAEYVKGGGSSNGMPCPYCGGEDTGPENERISWDQGATWITVLCQTCSREWLENFTLESITELGREEQYVESHAMRQGWILASNDEHGLRIEKYDEDPKQRFESDIEASEFVDRAASGGNANAKHALSAIAAYIVAHRKTLKI
jgi:hypothetical protein